MNILLKILSEFFFMMWDIIWGLAFGFILSSLIRAFVSTETISARLGKNSVAATGMSAFFGAVSSSCSYAAASMARTLVMKGATWTNAVTFMIASTNMVFEIFIVIVSLLGWAFFVGEIAGGVFFIILSSLLIVWLFPKSAAREAKEHLEASSNMQNDPHAHHAMGHEGMSDHSSGHADGKTHGKDMEHGHSHSSAGRQEKTPFSEKLKQAAGHFYMDVTMVGKDILIGVILASVMMVVVPQAFWQGLFLSGSSTLPHFVVLCWNAIAGILIAIFAFVCSVGNIVMASVLWHGGISFGGVIAFILADLVTIPMLMVYRRYYGYKTMWILLFILTAGIFITSLFLDYSFEWLHLIPDSPQQASQMQQNHFEWNYGTWLNFLFIPASVIYFFYGRKQMHKGSA